MSLAALSEYLIILVCLELPPEDISSLRQVCRLLCQATRAKVLWITKLEELRYDGHILPHYMKGYNFLDVITLEALVRRMARLADRWATGDLSPAKIWRLYLPQSITWLRLVAGTWLFVASSDNHTSKISCWDLSLVFQGYTEPLAEAYLPGQVKTGKLEVQDGGVVLALGLGAESMSVHIITLRQHWGTHVFSELSRIEGSSHVLMLCGDFVGCAVHRGAIVPHMVNWRDIRTHDLPPPPGGLDIPGRRSVPHLMTIWNGTLVIVRTNALEFYTLPSSTNDTFVFIKLIPTPTIWEAAVCDPTSVDWALSPPLRLIVISPLGIEMCVIEPELLAALDDSHTFVVLAKSPGYYRYDAHWYRLCIGGSGRRSLWIAAPVSEETIWSGPHFVCMTIPPLPLSPEVHCVPWSNHETGHSAQPALWALPVVDFDDALGLTIMGNCFGEIAIYDQDGRGPAHCGALGNDFTDQGSPIPPLLPTTPTFLGLSIGPPPPGSSMDLDPFKVSQWSQDGLVLPENWSTDWTNFWRRDSWQGAPDDLVWRFQHAYGFPGPVIPQAYADADVGCQQVIFRSGHRYFVFVPDTAQPIRSCPLTPLPTPFLIYHAQPEDFTRRTAMTEGMLYGDMFYSEMNKQKRNRWIEQAERGGQPHPNFLLKW